jgi:transcriptional regulator with XRE-family HTH domain
MDNRAEVRQFLISRRAKLTPQQAGLPDVGTRRVPGLRRGEVATLAGVSIEYYSKLERGAIAGASASVLDAIARALQLDDAERAHLFHLAHAADGTSAGMRPRRRPAKRWTPRPSLQWVLDTIGAPAIVRNGRMDILASNSLGHALYSPVFTGNNPDTANIARFQFLDPAARDFYPGWDQAADITVAIMRTEAGRDPHNRQLTDLVGELATRSEEFRIRWARHNVRLHYTGAKTFHHPAVGELHLTYEAVDLPTDDLHGLNLTIYTAQPGSASEDQIKLLASWTATSSPAPARSDSATAAETS